MLLAVNSINVVRELYEEYQVSFNSESNVYNVPVLKGHKVAPYEITKDNYAFDGWRLTDVNGARYDFSSKVTSDVTLYARWVEVSQAPGIVLNETQVDNVNPKISDGKVEIVYGDLVDWANQSQTPDESLGGNKDTLYVGVNLPSPEGTVTTSYNEIDHTAESTEPEIWRIYLPIADKDANGVYVPRGAYEKTYMFYYFDADGNMIGAYKIVASLEDYIERTVTIYNGDNEPQVTTLLNGKKITEPEAGERDGYVFDGFRLGSDAGELYKFDEPVTDDISIYARWVVISDVVDTNLSYGDPKVTNVTIDFTDGNAYVNYTGSVDWANIAEQNPSLGSNANGLHIGMFVKAPVSYTHLTLPTIA